MRMRAWAASVAILVAGASHGVRAEGAEPNPVAQAEQYAEAAFEAFSRGQYNTAVALYGEALAAAPSPEILFNLARIYDTKLRDRAHAIEYYARYAQDPGADAERLRVATDRLLALREQERVAAQLAAAEDSAAPSQAVTLPAQAPQPAKQRSLERGLSGYEIAGFLIGGLGVASVASGVGFGFAAKSDADVVHSLCDGDACSSQRGVDAARRGNRMALVSTITFAAGGGLLLLGAGLLLFGPRHAVRDDQHALRGARAQLTPWAGQSGFGLQLDSVF